MFSLCIMPAYLIWYRNEEKGFRHINGMVTIGRDACDFRLTDRTASRQHAVISQNLGEDWLTDHSSNGTFVNGKKIEAKRLSDGDEILFGSDSLKAVYRRGLKPEEIEALFENNSNDVTCVGAV